MTADATPRYDVAVVGGGPAGACAAGLLALEGRDVLLLERDKFPRYHIGESLITGVWPTLDRLGLRDRLEQAGFARKHGASVLWGSDQEFWGFTFDQAGPYEYVHQVTRAEFDALLLDRARELGVHVVEEATVRDPVFDGDRLTGLTYQVRGDDGVCEARAALTVDASGQRRWLGRHLGIVQWHEDLRNVAVWAYYQGGERYDGTLAGNTLIENLSGGWLWYIPLAHDLTSVGFVMPVEALTGSGTTAERLFEDKLASSREVAKMLAPARRVSGYRTARDWSYECSRFHGPGWVLVGDAAAFVDPLLSTGVALAVRGARVAADAVARALDEPGAEAGALAAYEEDARRFLAVILTFVRYFYDQTRSRLDYYEGAQQLVDPDQSEPPEFDFVKLVSGLAEDAPAVAPP